MTETMLVRTAGGAWEELRPQIEVPKGGVVELFGEDVGSILGGEVPIIVVACAPVLSTATPDAVCLDADGGIWILQLAMHADSSLVLPQLLAAGGGLTALSYDAFEELCTQTQGEPIAEFMEARSRSSFHRPSFEVAVADNLAHGKFQLVAVVKQASPSLVQSMRFLNSAGARGMLMEATSFASDTIMAVRAKAIDIGAGAGQGTAPSSLDSEALSDGAGHSDQRALAKMGAAAFVAATGKASGDDTGDLMAQLVKSCVATFDDTAFEGSAAKATMSALLDSQDGPVTMVVAGADGSITISFESLSSLDAGWGVREELCQGMERLLGADLGDVHKISQLNLSIEEHLMDATLMEALGELLADTANALRPDDLARSAREATAA